MLVFVFLHNIKNFKLYAVWWKQSKVLIHECLPKSWGSLASLNTLECWPSWKWPQDQHHLMVHEESLVAIKDLCCTANDWSTFVIQQFIICIYLTHYYRILYLFYLYHVIVSQIKNLGIFHEVCLSVCLSLCVSLSCNICWPLCLPPPLSIPPSFSLSLSL